MKSKKIQFGNLKLTLAEDDLEYKKDNISYYFPKIRNFKNPFILESKDISKIKSYPLPSKKTTLKMVK
jgi:hypothetical protein